MNPSTIKQLDEWMNVHCYNDSYGIGTRNIHEGYGVAVSGDQYIWYYTERGNRQHIQYFQTEQAAVEFALAAMINDKSANRHMVGFLANKSQVEELLTELQYRKIEFWKDEIPYGGPGNKRTRVFVFGCDIIKVADLQKRYLSIDNGAKSTSLELNKKD